MPIIARNTPKYIITLDPNDQFPEAGVAALLESGGLLTGWIKSYFSILEAPTTDSPMPTALKIFMQSTYGFGDLLPMKMTLHPNNHLSYPNDPDMHPLISIVHPQFTSPPLAAYIYQYGIIVIVENDSTFITRMD